MKSFYVSGMRREENEDDTQEHTSSMREFFSSSFCFHVKKAKSEMA